MSLFLTRMLDALDGDRVAFRCRGRTVTYGQAGRLLRGLHTALGDVAPGEVVGVLGGNRPETVLVQLAAQLRGADVLLVPASASLPGRVAACAGARVLAGPPDRALADAVGARVLDLDDAPADGPDPVVPPSVCTVFPSGGTTGPPKLIEHGGIYEGMARIFGGGDPGAVLVVAPVTHLTGHAAVLGALLGGDTVVLHDGFDASAVLAAIAGHRVTRLSLTPPRLAALLDHPALPATDVRSVHSLSLGASPLPGHRLRQALDVFGDAVGQGYGLTEAPMVASITAAEYAGHPERLGSVGRIVPGMEARIDDGEVLVRGLALMAGYRGRPELTEQSFADGWLRTGDLGRFDDDGYLYLAGRADDVIVTGEHGTKVYPAELEQALARCPGVRDVAVVGVPGANGTFVHAAVVPTGPGAVRARDVQAHARSTLGGEHFVPATVALLPELPLTEIGKVDRAALRANARAR